MEDTKDRCPNRLAQVSRLTSILDGACVPAVYLDAGVLVSCYRYVVADPIADSPYRTVLRKEESYAIHALIYAAEHPGAAAAKIALDLKMPPAFLAKVLRRLAQAEYVENRQGRNGGVTLLIDPEDVSLLDVVETMSGPLVVDTCQTKTRCATQERKGFCRLNVAWVNASIAIREVLSGVRLSHLIDPPRSQTGGKAAAAAGRLSADA